MMVGNRMILKDYIAESHTEQAEFIRLSILLTEMVYHVHQQTEVIGNLSPSNISIQWDRKLAILTEGIEWDKAYRSPEQTGRINRVPDNRSDLYALGVIFYEMLTGQMPVQPERAEDWDSVHIYKTPLLLSEIRQEWDGPLQSIIMKLLAKSPEERYQSAYGLLDDLKQCELMLVSSGQLVPFELGCLDKIRSFRLPDAMYGRSSAMKQLEDGVDQAAQGLQVFRWVTGHEGSGKTSLVHWLQPNIAGRGGQFVVGRIEYEQQGQVKPFEPLLQALREWIHQLWSEPNEVIMRLKDRLHGVFGQDLQAIVSLVPEIKLLSGDQSVETLTLTMDDWSQYVELFPSLIRCFADIKPPLLLFMDSLQWADEGTHAVIRKLAYEETIPGLILIGAWRMEELNCDLNRDALTLFTEPSWIIKRLRVHPEEHVTLLPLQYEDVRQYVSDTMVEDSARIRILSRLVYDQANGNPRSIQLLLKSWLREKKLNFDEKRREWTWDIEIIGNMGSMEANRTFMEASFADLSSETKLLLSMASVIGTVFRLPLLAEACDYKSQLAFHLLREAEAAGIICREDDAEPENGYEGLYLFLHDYMLQMAYAYDKEQNAHRHLKIGRLLQRKPSVWNDDTSSALIDHLNLGAACMEANELEQLPDNNLQAARKAIEAGNYAKGKRYAEAGLQLVSGGEFGSGSLYVQLKLILAFNEFMDNNADQARELLLDLNIHDQELTRAERSQIWTPLIQFHTFVDDKTAIKYGQEALAAYGWSLREKVSKPSLIKEMVQTQFLLSRMRNELHQLPVNHDEEYKTICWHMVQLTFPLLTHNPEALIELYARFIRYGLKKGMNELLANIIMIYKMLLQRVLPHYDQVVPSVNLLPQTNKDKSKVWPNHYITFIGGLSMQLDKPIEASVHIDKAMRWGLKLGDTDFVNLAMITCLITHNGNLFALSELLKFFEDHQQQKSSDKTLELVQIAGNYLAALQDESLHNSFVAIPASLSGAPEQPNEDNYSYCCKLEVAYLSGNYREALYWAKRGRESELASDWARIRKQRLYETLTLAALYPEANDQERKRIRRAIRKQLGKMRRWKGFLGLNSSAHLLMKAEWDRIGRNQLGALQRYTSAIIQARVEQYGLMEGVACERLAVYFQTIIMSREGATIAMMDACTAYSVWGITSKVIQIRNQHGDLLNYESMPREDQVLEMKPKSNRTSIGMLQYNTSEERSASTNIDELLQQIVTWSSKLNKDKWQDSFLEAALRQAGADRGFVLSCRDDSFHIEAGSEQTLFGSGDSWYAESILRHVYMTKQSVALNDASISYYLKDTYIQAQRPRSILCMPIMVPKERSLLLLYLENRHVSCVFTDHDQNVLELIASRMIYSKLLQDEAEEAIAPAVTNMENQSLIEPLTSREMEVLSAVAGGLSNKDIAERLGISETTVKTHISNIFGKLGVKRRGQAVVRAKELNLLVD